MAAGTEHPDSESMAVAEGEGQPPQLSPVATVLQTYHLAKISDDNRRLMEEHAKMDSVWKSMTTVTLRYGDGHEMVADLHDTICVRKDGANWDNFLHFTETSREELADGRQMMVPLHESPAAPLSQLKDLFACRAYQRVGAQRGAFYPKMDEDKNGDVCVSCLILLSDDLAVRVDITGLSDADMERFTEEESGSEMLTDYLQTGTGLLGEEGVFYPTSIRFHMTNEMQEIFDLLRADYEGQPLSSSIKKKEHSRLEQLRRGIVKAIGATDVQREVLEDNEALLLESNKLEAMLELLGTVKINHPEGARSLLLKDGRAGMKCACDCPDPNRFSWFLNCSEREDLVFKVDDLYHLHPMLSGTELRLRGPLLTREDEDSTAVIWMEYDNGTEMYGICNTDELEDDTEVKLMTIALPLRLLEDTLEALGVDYSVDDGFVAARDSSRQ